MGRQSIWEYLRAVYARYRRADRPTKQKILDEFCANTGYHRKHALRLWNGPPPGRARPQPDHPARRRPAYGKELLGSNLPERYSTSRSYRSYLQKWIEPKWRDYILGEVKSLAVEKWLASLPLALKSQRHIRGIMRVVFQCAVRWELIGKNPMDLVRVKEGTKRLRIPGFCVPRVFRACCRNSDSRTGPWS